MATPHESARAADRDRALRAITSWTWAAGVAGIGLTGVLAVVAAGSFAGHQTAAAAAVSASTSVDPSSSPDSSLQQAPQPAPQDSLGNSNQPPAAVSGGS